VEKFDIETIADWCCDWADNAPYKKPGWRIENQTLGGTYKVTLRFQAHPSAPQVQVSRVVDMKLLNRSKFPYMELQLILGGAAKSLEDSFGALVREAA